jgi:hypothetical protein
MAVSLVSTGVTFPSGATQTSASTAYKDMGIMTSLYGEENPKFTLSNNVFTKLRIGTYFPSSDTFTGGAELDTVNNGWKIKKAGYYSFDVGVSILHQNYLTPDKTYGISKFIIAYGRNGGNLEQENGWYVYDGTFSQPAGGWHPYPVWLAKDCNFNTYCNVDDVINIYVLAQTAFSIGLMFISALVFSGHMLS